ncbi:enoyl-CoA hydratase/isomerase family protein [Spongiibacter nanhainus]|uniref:Enoyl-CoA hydratase/isomerase family protein n=1 Tax=Spongiibacter nanhainus TaxID=2794344 RepID=A0A7T4R191_9GAMM|nr:enoyl-CoA hydratase-related protein [Spongiibacter nanhainus]QQD18579.1 enoyl-CoA hydratase/isomerase family protein [Spongiibacter nanhainus]
MSESELVQELSADGKLRLIMNRPEVHNAFDDRQVANLTDALLAAAENPGVRLVVIEGRGKNFCAGGDINYMRRMGENTFQENVEDARRLATLMKVLNDLPKPTIARVQGAAMGGGVGLVCCCDIAVGEPNTFLALSEIKIGMVPATIAPYVVKTIGPKPARRLFMTGEKVSASRAEALGMLSEVVADGSLDSRIAEISTTLLANAPSGLAKAKQIIERVSRGGIDEKMIEDTVRFIAEIRDSTEGREGLSAFLEKRKPNWSHH